MSSSESAEARVGGIVLAAGMSTRMGSPKPLLPLGNEPMLVRVLDAMEASRSVCSIVVVTGHAADRVRAVVDGRGIVVVHNPDYENGEMLSSIKAGLTRISPGVDAVLLALCDQPMVRSETIALLVKTWQATRPRILSPKYDGKRGHPIVLSADGFAEILSLSPDATLKAYTSRYSAETVELEVDDPAVTRDVDTPADYAAEQERRNACIKRTPA